ncbi:MAG: hypothetical protein LVQ95_00615 [Candidatus Micrarchaeales archaeon]|nr:hypothetical protein [Candidatus Micrarchaeales archaeon]
MGKSTTIQSDSAGVETSPIGIGSMTELERALAPSPSSMDTVRVARTELILRGDEQAIALETGEGDMPKLERRLFGEEEIKAAVLSAAKDKRYQLAPCLFHSGQEETARNLYSFDPKVGIGVCLHCKEFIEHYGTPEQERILIRWEEGLPYEIPRHIAMRRQ